MNEINKLIIELLSKVDFSKTRIKNIPNFVFLCGADKEQKDTIRALTNNYIKQKDPSLYESMKFAEDFLEWEDDEYYRNLVDLEEDLAHIVSFIPVVSESPGAVAELAAFVNNEYLLEKMKVYINRSYAIKKSYIAHGPIKKLRDKNPEKVFIYDTGYENAVAEEIYKDIIKISLLNFKKTEGFNPSNKTHQFLFICEIVRILSLSRITEIKQACQLANINLKQGEIKKFLKLCEKVGLIHFKVFGTSDEGTFYTAENKNYNFIEFKYFPNVARPKKDLLRWKAKLRETIIKEDSVRRTLLLNKKKVAKNA